MTACLLACVVSDNRKQLFLFVSRLSLTSASWWSLTAISVGMALSSICSLVNAQTVQDELFLCLEIVK